MQTLKEVIRHKLMTMNHPLPEVRQPHGSDEFILVWTGEAHCGSHDSINRICDGLKELCFARLNPLGYQLKSAKIITGEPFLDRRIQWTIVFTIQPL